MMAIEQVLHAPGAAERGQRVLMVEVLYGLSYAGSYHSQ